MGEKGGDYIPSEVRDQQSRVDKKEYAFEAGLVALDECIRQKLTEKNCVFVAIVGSSAHVGKSQLCKELDKRFLGSVPMVWEENADDFGSVHRTRLDDRQSQCDSTQSVMVTGQSFIGQFFPGDDIHRVLDFLLFIEKKHQKKGGFPLPDSYDVVVAISSKEAPFDYPYVIKDQVDVFIVNEYAAKKTL